MTADVKAQAEALLNGATAPDTWYFQPGWGLQFAPEPGTLGLLVSDDAPAKTGDLLLMEAAPKLARQVVELAEEVERLKAEAASIASDMQTTLSFLAEQERDALNDGMSYDTAARYHARQATLAPYARRVALLATQEARHD